jgi:phenylpyruvate tautomerase PptA (4-oxalocrotonate tautomerase family)
MTRLQNATVRIDIETNKGEDVRLVSMSDDETKEEFIERVTEALKELFDAAT